MNFTEHLKATLIVALSALAPAVASAEVPDVTLNAGYGCDIASSYWGCDEKSHISAAIRLDASQLHESSISAIKFDLSLQPDVIDCIVFVKKNLDRQENLYEQEFSPVNGENIVWLDFPVSVRNLEELYVGYEFTGRGDIAGYATVAAEKYSPDGDLVRSGTGTWEHLAGLTGAGSMLSLSAVLTRGDYSAFKQHALEVPSPLFYNIVTAGESNNLNLSVINDGVGTLKSFTVMCSSDGGEVETHDFQCELIHRGVATVAVPVTVADGPRQVTVTVSAPMAEPKVHSWEVTGYERTFPRIPLVELYSTQTCANCPSGKAVLEKALRKSGVSHVTVGHHSGYSPDNYTIAGSESLANALGVTSAPSMTLDRRPGVLSEGLSPVFHPGLATAGIFAPYLMVNCLHGIEVESATFNRPDGRFSVSVKVVKDPSEIGLASVKLHAVVVEDGIVDYQNDLGVFHPEWIHNHVVRAFLTPVEGECVQFGDDATVTVTLSGKVEKVEGSKSPEVVGENLKLVAFISEDSPSGISPVLNAVEVVPELTDVASVAGVSENMGAFSVNGNVVTASGGQTVKLYDISGRIVASLSGGQSVALRRGCYIVNSDYASPVKIAVY